MRCVMVERHKGRKVSKGRPAWPAHNRMASRGYPRSNRGAGMIPRESLPPISSILSRLDIPIGRRGRTLCPIHRSDNNQAFSYDDGKGQWFCFRCGIGGDAVELVKKALDLNFKDALQWLGISGKSSPRNSQMMLVMLTAQQRYRQQLDRQRKLRDEYRIRCLIEKQGFDRLRRYPYSAIGWELLAVAYSGPGLDAIQYELDQLLEEIPREAYRRRAA
jgi:hypothetical protein